MNNEYYCVLCAKGPFPPTEVRVITNEVDPYIQIPKDSNEEQGLENGCEQLCACEPCYVEKYGHSREFVDAPMPTREDDHIEAFKADPEVQRALAILKGEASIICQNEAHGARWSAYHGDSVVGLSGLPADSAGFSVYSPPFAKLYIYSESVADMGNCDTDEQFLEQYAFVVRELYRVTKPGRLTAVHCQDITRMKCMDGEIGIKNLSGKIIDLHTEMGWVYHSRITIWKDPVVEMQRTKALGLLHKQLKKDSTMSRVGLPDYLLIFRKPGVNREPVTHTGGSGTPVIDATMPENQFRSGSRDIPVSLWQEWASPVWMTVRQTHVLDTEGAREAQDEKHVCPLQLDVIERALHLWSNPDDVVISPFMGIGSEGHGALRAGRRFVGFELKGSYFKQACAFLKQAEAERDLPIS